MKILAIGDFHGKFSKKLERLIKKEKIDLVVSVGDYLPFFYRDLWFEYCYKTDLKLWEVIGKRNYKLLLNEDILRGEKVLKKLNALPVSVISVLGNVDWPLPDDIMDVSSGKVLGYEKKDRFAKKISKYKNIKLINYSYAKFGDYVFIGMRGHSAPGKVKSKAYRKYKAKLEKLFLKFRLENKNSKVIFVGHNSPYDTKLDRISSGELSGKHYGSKMAKRLIQKFQPVLFLGGHIHERYGKDKVGRTICINTGSFGSGKGAIVEFGLKGGVKKVKLL